VIVHQEQREVLGRILLILLAIYHGVAEVCVHLLRNYIHELAFPFFALVCQQNLRGLPLRDLVSACQLLYLRLVATEHLLKDTQVPLVLERDSREQRVVIGCVLVQSVIAHQNHLHLLHVSLLIHLEGAAVDDLV